MTGGGGGPKQADQAAAVMASMGITSYEPRVINQLLEFTYREAEAVLKSAARFAASRSDAKQVEPSDIRVAINTRALHHFDQRPTLDQMRQTAQGMNATAFPDPPSGADDSDAVAFIPLPPETVRMTTTYVAEPGLEMAQAADAGAGSAMEVDVQNDAPVDSPRGQRGNFNKKKSEKQIVISFNK
jgi:transcription initiation factor TFIID subunit 9B